MTVERIFSAEVTEVPNQRSMVCLSSRSPAKPSALDGAYHRGVGGLGRRGDLHRRMLQHHLAVVVDIADHGPAAGGKLVRRAR